LRALCGCQSLPAAVAGMGMAAITWATAAVSFLA
jgi:hypothetical protein